MATGASENTFLGSSNSELQGDDAKSHVAASNKKNKGGQCAAGGDKGNRGLRQFSIKVCEKVESRGRTTYNEVADELVTEFADPINSDVPPGELQYDDKNIRRRVYDALNVLMAMDIISKDKKEIQWKGLPRSSPSEVEELKAERLALRNRIEERVAHLQDLEDQIIGYENLVERNHRVYESQDAPNGGVTLPFILVQATMKGSKIIWDFQSEGCFLGVIKTRPNATVEVEISEDMQLVHFDFNSSPFELHDDHYVLKQMKLCGSSSGNAQNLFPNGGESSGMPCVNQPEIPQSLHPSTLFRDRHILPAPHQGTVVIPSPVTVVEPPPILYVAEASSLINLLNADRVQSYHTQIHWTQFVALPMRSMFYVAHKVINESHRIEYFLARLTK